MRPGRWPTSAAALLGAAGRSRWRMEVTERADGVLVVNDAYNANPESMRAALKTLAAVARSRRARARSFAVLGPMAELGADAPAEHDGDRPARRAAGHHEVVAVGEDARPIAARRGSGRLVERRVALGAGRRRGVAAAAARAAAR